jgi:hypothetical protein
VQAIAGSEQGVLMPATIHAVTLDPGGAIPDVEVIIGQAQVGAFECYLWDTQGTNPQLLFRGNSLNGLPDQFSVGIAAANLSNRYLSWEVARKSPSSNAGELFSLIITIRQAGNVVQGGLIEESGAFDQGSSNTKGIVEFARFG